MLTRKRRKPRARGTGCQGPKCRRLMVMEVDGLRFCELHAADRLVGNLVRARDGGRCRRCGTPPNEGSVNDWAHVHPRHHHATRWMPENAVTLCRGCHTYFGMGGRRAEWEQWCRDQGIDWDGLRILALTGIPERADDVIARLTRNQGGNTMSAADDAIRQAKEPGRWRCARCGNELPQSLRPRAIRHDPLVIDVLPCETCESPTKEGMKE